MASPCLGPPGFLSGQGLPSQRQGWAYSVRPELNMPEIIRKCERIDRGLRTWIQSLPTLQTWAGVWALQLLTNDIIIPFLLTDDHAFLITGHVLTGRTLGTGGSGGQQRRPPTGRQGTSLPRSCEGGWSPILGRRLRARVRRRARHHLQDRYRESLARAVTLGSPPCLSPPPPCPAPQT